MSIVRLLCWKSSFERIFRYIVHLDTAVMYTRTLVSILYTCHCLLVGGASGKVNTEWASKQNQSLLSYMEEHTKLQRQEKTQLNSCVVSLSLLWLMGVVLVCVSPSPGTLFSGTT